MKKLLCNTLIIIIMLGVFCNGYFSFSGLSFSYRFSYAEADNWSACDSSDLVTAFRYYCKSRNLAIEGSAADALTTFTTTTFNNICSSLGIDPTSLSAELKKTTEGNLGLRFLFSNTGITAYNRIFAEFLQNNDLAVGDEVEDQNVYDGEKYTDSQGNSCLLFYINTSSATGMQSGVSKSLIVKYGSYYMMSNDQLYSNATSGSPVSSISVPKNDGTNVVIELPTGLKTDSQGDKIGQYIGWNNAKGYAIRATNYNVDGFPIVYKISGDNYTKLYVGKYYTNHKYTAFTGDNVNYFGILNGTSLSSDNTTTEPADVNITTNNQTINNNVYNNNYTIIYNDGDTYISDDDDEPLPTTPPSGGGGGDDPVDPDPNDPLDPYDPNKPFPDTPDNPTPDPGVHGSPGSDGTITIPDFNFDLPDINWSLDGLQHKFPFSLPFDLYNACKLLNAEPQTPELDYTVDLVVYQWPIQMDLHWLDPAARVIRIFELLAFVIGLILITRHLIGG